MKTFKDFWLLENKKEVIAVDLDGTLAHYTHYQPCKIGKPIPKMLQRIKKWIKEGKTVVIFTARANRPKEVQAIQTWLQDQGLPDLKITNIKTPDMKEFWDDRAINVKKNTGQIDN